MEVTHSALRSARLLVNLIGSPINYANRLIGSPITSQSTEVTRLVGVQAKLCAERGVPHIINNAYGIQSASLCGLVTAAWRKGRVDAIVQSTDKNFMVGARPGSIKT
jgi:O-phospho-L-seryl-tRNASec:L-selenocysteinyl-tRNA synthase